MYVQVLRRMTPEQRLKKAFELRELGMALFRRGLESRNPDLSAGELKELVRQHEDRWRNRIY
jgi:hypothetical protein